MASKSKQNKPADRGHKENTPLSKDVASTNPKSRGNNPRNRAVNFDWSQDDSDVKISFPIGKKLGEQDVDAEFTNTSATVKFKDGRKWHCKFYSEIVKEISRVKISKRQLIIQVGKKEQGVTWPSLEYIVGKPAEKKMAPKLEILETAEQARQEHNVDIQKPSGETQKPPASTQKPSVNTQKPSVSTPEPSANIQKASVNTQEQSVTTQESSVNTPTVTTVPSSENRAEQTTTSDENKITEKKEEEPPYSLPIIKHDWYEKAPEVLVVHVYVKQLKKDDLKVTFEDKGLTVLFKTSDSKFLSLHKGTTEDTTFRWTITLHDELTPTACKHRVTTACIELTLQKKVPKRWGVLEAPQHKDPVDNQSEPPKPNTWIPVAPSTANKENEKPKDNEKMSKVIFDELSNEKPSVTDLEDAQPVRDTVKETKDYVTQKPTCMVSPLNKDAEGQVVPPGMTGLDNLGNTCFMNSVLQVLANTRELRDFFLEGLFQKEINPENPLGTGGKLAVAFAVLMRVLWSGKHRSYAPSKLKNLVAMKASQFTGFAQHDAQEFMAFLLDGLHEDVNRIKKKPYTQTVDSDGRPDEVVADEAWMVHKKRNDSFIVDLFQGQYKSKLVCPMCGKVSITFDPFMILPVPLPKKKRPLPVIFMSHDPYRKPLRIMLQLPKDAVTEQLKEAVAQKTGVSPKNMKVFEAYKNKILKFFSKGESLANVSSSDRIIVSEVMSEEMAGEPVKELAVLQRTMLPYQVPTRCTFCRRDARPGEKLKRCTKCFRAAYCDHQCQRHDWQQKHRTMCKFSAEPVGCPFIISLPQSQATFTRLVQMAEAYARYSVDVFQPPVTQEQKSPAPPATVSTPGDKNESETKDELRRSSTASSTLTSSSSVASELSTESSFVSTSSEQDLFTKASSPDEASTSESSSADSSTLKEVSSREQSGDSEGSMSPALSPSVSTEDINQESCLMNKDKIDVNKPSGSQRPAETNMTLECKETLSSPEVGDINTQKAPPTRYVMGRPHDLVEGQTPNFNLRPCDKDGKVFSGERGATLNNKGEEAIDLSCNYYLAMDWRNKDKLKSYVLVQSKDLEYDDDPSMHTVNLEETNFTVDQCLSLFTEPEVLSPEHAWYCPDCKEHREATKQLSIWRLPHTLIIQLKRFSFRNLIWRDKIDKMVDFPVRGLDLSNYYMGTRPSTEPPPVYDLYGVVNHHGGLLGGHYTAFGRCPQLADSKQNEVGWRLFDDSIVSYTSEKQVVTRSAYVLFYRRRNCNMPLFDNKALYTDEEEQVESSPGQKPTDEIITQDKDCIMAGGDTVDLTSRNASGFFVGSDDSATDMDAVD